MKESTQNYVELLEFLQTLEEITEKFNKDSDTWEVDQTLIKGHKILIEFYKK